MNLFLSLCMTVVFVLAGGAAARADVVGTQTAAEGLRTETITIVTQTQARHSFTVEVADTPLTMAQGLMFRTALAEDAGMLFIFPQDGVQSFWMKNTLIPLDMLFIKADGHIATLHENAVPHDLTPVTSGVPVSRVLEVKGGTIGRLGLKVGDRAFHSTFFGNELAE